MQNPQPGGFVGLHGQATPPLVAIPNPENKLFIGGACMPVP